MVHQVCAVGALYHLFHPPYSKAEASKQTIGLLEATDPEHRARPQSGLPWTFPGLEYRCWPPQVLGGPREGEMASKLRGAATSTWPPGGAGRRASIEVEETSESRQTENSHQCTCAEHLALAGMKWTGPGPVMSMLSSLQPRETDMLPGPQALPSYILPGEVPSWCSWNLPHHPFPASLPSLGSNRRQTRNNQEPSKLPFTQG